MKIGPKAEFMAQSRHRLSIANKKNTEEIKRAWLLSMAYSLKCDPNAMLNGAIRNLESSITALKVAMTEYLLMMTLHANNSLNILKRL